MASLDTHLSSTPLNKDEQCYSISRNDSISRIVVPITSHRRRSPTIDTAASIAAVKASFDFEEKISTNDESSGSQGSQKLSPSERFALIESANEKAENWVSMLVEAISAELRKEKTHFHEFFMKNFFAINDRMIMNSIIRKINLRYNHFWTLLLQRHHWTAANCTLQFLEVLQVHHPLLKKSCKITTQFLNDQNEEFATFALECGAKPNLANLTAKGKALYRSIRRSIRKTTSSKSKSL
jgi:hypothetical protein